MTRRGSKRYFAATAAKTHRKNLRATPMRGGFRIQYNEKGRPLEPPNFVERILICYAYYIIFFFRVYRCSLMTCYHPVKAYLPPDGCVNPKTGNRRLSFNPPVGSVALGWQEVKVPCGSCIGCRLDKAATWAMRCMHESQLHERNVFITLTFNDENLNPDMSLHKEDYVNFMKRLRKQLGDGIRFFHCGEYGDLNQRPHHHAILFNCDFEDKVLWQEKTNGVRIYRSPTLERLWPFGYSSIGNVTYQSCGYVARYCLKKITGKQSEEYYKGRIPPYITMSRRPGIGREWFNKYWRDVYPNDFCVVEKGHLRKPPRYYDEIYSYLSTFVLDDDKLPSLDELKEKRKERAIELDNKKYDDEYEKYTRLDTREIVKERQIEGLKRGL